MEQRHERIAEIALSTAGEEGLALAGGYAIRAHGMGQRPSGDVDLFMDWQRRADFPSVLDLVVDALASHGYSVTVQERGETFARLLVQEPQGSEPDKVEMAADWRSHPPVKLAIGPVLHADDAVANKMSALYNRALPRDFLDVDAAITSNRYSRERLLHLAETADGGFDRGMFAQALGVLTQITDDAFAVYGLSSAEISAMRRRFAEWRVELMETTNQ